MATLKELMGDLTRGDGRKVTCCFWDIGAWFEPIYLAEGMWFGVDERGDSVEFQEEDPAYNFKEFKTTKKIKLFKPVLFHGTNDKNEKTYHAILEWHSDKNYFQQFEVAGWLEMEAEVEA